MHSNTKNLSCFAYRSTKDMVLGLSVAVKLVRPFHGTSEHWVSFKSIIQVISIDHLICPGVGKAMGNGMAMDPESNEIPLAGKQERKTHHQNPKARPIPRICKNQSLQKF